MTPFGGFVVGKHLSVVPLRQLAFSRWIERDPFVVRDPAPSSLLTPECGKEWRITRRELEEKSDAASKLASRYSSDGGTDLPAAAPKPRDGFTYLVLALTAGTANASDFSRARFNWMLKNVQSGYFLPIWKIRTASIRRRQRRSLDIPIGFKSQE